ncbi:hypothetical protein BDU57DRAFT_180371 [Ampelomyces quisqualis]|uniref:Uncharacterized protein n=1 Tax=Ampelomyces quisqualis TaxID=50730 RepID=A0A6A5QR81_AMPQU|nr:hypothetical protein BDU57DRAFT_180371 [Ampelomyces quisqualis]
MMAVYPTMLNNMPRHARSTAVNPHHHPRCSVNVNTVTITTAATTSLKYNVIPKKNNPKCLPSIPSILAQRLYSIFFTSHPHFHSYYPSTVPTKSPSASPSTSPSASPSASPSTSIIHAFNPSVQSSPSAPAPAPDPGPLHVRRTAARVFAGMRALGVGVGVVNDERGVCVGTDKDVGGCWGE